MPRSKTQDSLKKNLAKTTKPQQKKRTTKKESIKFTKRKDAKLFPHHETFPWRLEDRKENKTCWFQCFEHAEKYITRYNLESKDYKLMEKA
jgi:hypothetical protein